MNLVELDLLVMGDRIRECRKRKNLSRSQLAERLNLSAKFIADVECGNKGLSLKSFMLLIQILDVSADYLLLGRSSKIEPDLICELKIRLDESV